MGTDNEIASDGTWDYSYDAEGNMTEKINIATGEYWDLRYDLNNMLTEAVDYNPAAPSSSRRASTTMSSTT